MPLLNVLDEIEDAIHNDRSKQITFWDIRRAFDSIPRHLQRLAWIRLGVPLDVASWLVSLDDGGLSFIGSPHYFHSCSLRSADELLQASSHITKAPDLGFTAHRGIGQGESASSLQWVALYDILLEWIDPRNTHLHEAEDLPPLQQVDLDTTIINAYADDLATITGGPRAADMQQQQATWLSAFCAFTGLTMHPRKIIATTIGPPMTHTPSLSIRDAQWHRVDCTVTPDLASVKYLGTHLDLRNTDTLFKRTFDDLATRTSHLLLQPGPPQAKVDYIRNKILPIARYTAMLANWPLARYRQLDRPLSAAYRRILALPKKFPSSLLYLSKRDVVLDSRACRTQHK